MEKYLIMPGSTPRHSYELPFPPGTLDFAEVTYSQGDAEVISKRVEDFDAVEDPGYCAAVVHLTQAETLLFADGIPCVIQINAVDQDGSRCGSTLAMVRVAKQTKMEVLTDDV